MTLTLTPETYARLKALAEQNDESVDNLAEAFVIQGLMRFEKLADGRREDKQALTMDQVKQFADAVINAESQAEDWRNRSRIQP